MRRIMFRVDVNLLYALHRSGLSSSTARLAALADVEKVSCWLRMMIDDWWIIIDDWWHWFVVFLLNDEVTPEVWDVPARRTRIFVAGPHLFDHRWSDHDHDFDPEDDYHLSTHLDLQPLVRIAEVRRDWIFFLSLDTDDDRLLQPPEAGGGARREPGDLPCVAYLVGGGVINGKKSSSRSRSSS